MMTLQVTSIYDLHYPSLESDVGSGTADGLLNLSICSPNKVPPTVY